MNNKSLQKISEVIWNSFKYKRALFFISSLWLGHAARTLPIIKHYLKLWFSISVISYWNSLTFLRQELKDYKNIKFTELHDYPWFERWTWFKFYLYLLIDTLNFNRIVLQENNFIKTLDDDFDFIFSDWRYGGYKKNVPSFLLSHQISFIMPKWLNFLKSIVNFSNYKYFKKFTAIFIPDFEDEKKSLAWKLSHSKILKKLKHYYIWILTAYDWGKSKIKDIDYYFIISWYLQEHKQSFVNKLIEQAKNLDGKKVFVLWDTSKKDVRKLKKYNIKIYSSVSSKKRIDFFERANIIISRAWYTTIMDLVTNNKKAVLFPTQNQTEQEYLAEYLEKKWLFVNWWQKSFDLKNLIKLIK